MNISLADNTVKSQVKNLWHDCFGDTDPYLSWYFDNIYQPENTVVATENGVVLGAAQVRCHKIVMHGKTYNCGYVCGVSTQPMARGKKIGSAIMEKAAEVSKSRDCEFNILVPIIDGFYEKNGFVRCFDRTEYIFETKDFPQFTTETECTLISPDDSGKALEIYNKFTAFYDCYMIRTKEYFSQLVSQYIACGGGCAVFESGGYILFYPENGKLHVEEAIALTDSAANDILQFVSSRDHGCESVILRCGEKDVFSLILNTLYVKCIKTHNVNIQPFFMSETEILIKSGKIDSSLAVMMGLQDKTPINTAKILLIYYFDKGEIKMIYLFLADGFEEMEAIAPVDVLRRGGVEIKTVSITDSLTVTGSHGIPVTADITCNDVDLTLADGVILPGGIPGTPNLKASPAVKTALETVNAKGGLIAAICAAPSILGAFGYLKGKKATCYPGFEGELDGAQFVKESAVTDGNVITGCGAGGAFDFAFELLTYLKDAETATNLKKGMLYE